MKIFERLCAQVCRYVRAYFYLNIYKTFRILQGYMYWFDIQFLKFHNKLENERFYPTIRTPKFFK